MKSFSINRLIAILLCCSFHTMAQQRVTVLDSSQVNPVWSGHPVDFSFVNKGDSLYAGYYYGNTKSPLETVPFVGSY